MNGNDCIEFKQEHHDKLVEEFVKGKREEFIEFVESLDKEQLKKELLDPDYDGLVESFIEANRDEYQEYANNEASEYMAWEETKWSLMNDR